MTDLSEQNDSKAEAQRKELQAIIEASAIIDSTLGERLTVAAVWQYSRLPDASYGWANNDGPMPTQAKAICIITTLSLGLMPGVGHVLWLGNSAYVSADARRFLANRSTDLVKTGQAVRRALTPDEKEMYDVKPGDRAMIIEQPVRWRGEPSVWIGLGILGADEPLTNKYGKPMPGRGSTKDRAMTLITRAERDMLKRNFPLGLADSEDAPPAIDVTHEDLTPRIAAPTLDQVAATAAATARREALQRLTDLIARTQVAGGNALDVLDGLDPTELRREGTPADRINDAGDVLEAWLMEHEPTDPTPPSTTPPKRGRGRPPKDKAEPAPQAPPPTAEVPASPEPAAALATPAPGPAPSPSEVVYEQELEQVFPITQNTNMAPPDWELQSFQAAQARLRASLARVKVFAPMRTCMQLTGRNEHNYLGADAVPTSAGAAAAHALCDFLDSWDGKGPTPLEAAKAASDARQARRPEPTTPPPPPDDVPPVGDPAPSRPAAPPAPPPPAKGAFPRVPAHDAIARTLADPTTSELLADALRRLAALELRSGDHLHLPKAIREAKAGNFRGLDELIRDRGGVR